MYPLTAVCMTALPFPDQQVPDPRNQSGVGEGGGWERELKEGVSQVPPRPSFSTCADQEDLRRAEAKSAAGVDRSINRNRIRE